MSVAALDRDRRYEEWYPLLLEEIAIVGKPGGPVIAIGKKVGTFLRQLDPEGKDRPTPLRRPALFHASVCVLEGRDREGPRGL